MKIMNLDCAESSGMSAFGFLRNSFRYFFCDIQVLTFMTDFTDRLNKKDKLQKNQLCNPKSSFAIRHVIASGKCTFEQMH